MARGAGFEPKCCATVTQTEKNGGKQNSLEDQVLVSVEQVFEKSKYPRRYNQKEE